MESGERSNDHDNKNNKQQTTTTTSTSRYLLPFSRITVSVAWYIYLTVLKCICNVGLKKIISRSINYYTIPSTYMYLHQHAHLTLPHLTFSSHLIHTFPTTPSHTRHSHTHTLSVTISGLPPPTHLPYRTQVYLAFNVLLFLFLCLPCFIKYTYIHTFLFYQPSLPLGRYPPTLPIYFSYLPAQPSSVPTCLPVLSRMLYVVCCVLAMTTTKKSTL